MNNFEHLLQDPIIKLFSNNEEELTVARILDIGRATAYALAKSPDFPKGTRLTKRGERRWRLSTVIAWRDAKFEQAEGDWRDAL